VARFGSINADTSREPNILCLQNYYVSLHTLIPARRSCLLQATVPSTFIVEAIPVRQELALLELRHCFLGVRRPHWRPRIVNTSRGRLITTQAQRTKRVNISLGTIAGIDKPSLFAWILWSRALAQGTTPEVYIHHHSGFLPPRDVRESNSPALLDI